MLIDSAVNEKGNYGLTYNIDLESWYHIEIVQATDNGKVRDNFQTTIVTS